MASLLGGGGRGRVAADRPPGVIHNCTKVHGAVLVQADMLELEGRTHLEVPWACCSRDTHSSLAVSPSPSGGG